MRRRVVFELVEAMSKCSTYFGGVDVVLPQHLLTDVQGLAQEEDRFVWSAPRWLLLSR